MPRFHPRPTEAEFPRVGPRHGYFNIFPDDFNVQPRLKTTVVAGLLEAPAVLLHSLLSVDISLLNLQKTYRDPVCDLGHAI